MRFKHKPEPRIGELKIVVRFLVFPKRIGNETRWLESAAWRRRWIASEVRGNEVFGGRWSDLEWVDA